MEADLGGMQMRDVHCMIIELGCNWPVVIPLYAAHERRLGREQSRERKHLYTWERRSDPFSQVKTTGSFMLDNGNMSWIHRPSYFEDYPTEKMVRIHT